MSDRKDLSGGTVLLKDLLGEYEGSLDFRRIGPSVNLIKLEAAARDLCISTRTLLACLREFKIPLVKIGPDRMFNMYWLERILFLATSPDHKDFNLEDPPGDIGKGTLETTWEMSIAGATYMSAHKEGLLARLRMYAKSLQQRTWRKTLTTRK